MRISACGIVLLGLTLTDCVLGAFAAGMHLATFNLVCTWVLCGLCVGWVWLLMAWLWGDVVNG